MKQVKIILTISIILFIMSILVLNIFENVFNIKQIENFKNYKMHFYQMNGILPLIISVCLLLLALNKTFESKMINLVSSTTFGIYLFHDNMFMRPYLWKNIINCSNYKQVGEIIIAAFISAIFVFIVGMIIELIRQRIFELWLYAIKRYHNLLKRQ